MSWNAIDVVLTIVIKIDRNNIIISLFILSRYGFYVLIFNGIMYNGNVNNSKTIKFENTSTHGTPLLFNSKVLARSYVTATISTIEKH